jgi:hypothetical protein
MSKMIIENRSSISDSLALECARAVISAGRISNNGKQYCYLSTMDVDDNRVAVATDLNKASDRFIVTDYDDKYYKERSEKLNKSVKNRQQKAP